MSKRFETAISVRTIVRLVLRYAWLYLLALAVAAVAIYYIAGKMGYGQAQYKASVMTRFPVAGHQTNLVDNYLKRPIWQKVPAYDADQIYGRMIAAQTIYRAGKEIGFDIDYYQHGFLRTNDVYDGLDFQLRFPDAYDSDDFTLTVRQEGDVLTISEIQGVYHGSPIASCTGRQWQLTIGQNIETCIGRVIALSSPPNQRLNGSIYQEGKPISVHRMNSNFAETLFDRDMEADRLVSNLIMLQMNASGSPRRVLELMERMIDVVERETARAMLEDLDEERAILLAAIAALDTAPAEISTTNRANERNRLEQLLLANNADRQLLSTGKMLEVTDPPTMRPRANASKWLKILLVLLAIAGPTLLLYLGHFFRRSILGKKLLSDYWRSRLIAEVTQPLKGSDTSLTTQLAQLATIEAETQRLAIVSPMGKEFSRFVKAYQHRLEQRFGQIEVFYQGKGGDNLQERNIAESLEAVPQEGTRFQLFWMRPSLATLPNLQGVPVLIPIIYGKSTLTELEQLETALSAAGAKVYAVLVKPAFC